MRLQLDSSGTQVAAVRPLAVAQPVFDYPSYGTILGEDLYYFANSQWQGERGVQTAVTVLRTALDSNQDLLQPDMRRYLEQQAKRNKERAKETEKN